MKKWSKGAKILHWVVAVVITIVFILGKWMVGLDYWHQWYHNAPVLHQSLGMVLFILMVIRVCWRLKYRAPSPLSTRRSEVVLAKLMHLALYGLIFVIIISGYLVVTAGGEDVNLFGIISLPSLPIRFEDRVDFFGAWHLYLANTTLFLVVLHILAALKHHLIDKDNTLKRML